MLLLLVNIGYFYVFFRFKLLAKDSSICNFKVIAISKKIT